METLCPINMTDYIPMSAESSDNNSDVLSHDEAESSADDVINTPSATGSSSVKRRLFTASEKNGPNAAKNNAVGYLTKATTNGIVGSRPARNFQCMRAGGAGVAEITSSFTYPRTGS